MSEFELPILPYTALIIGNRACGKTSLVNDLLTKSSVNNYLAVVPFLSHNMCYQKQIVSIKPDQYLWNGGQTIVLDNCILSSSQWKSNAFRKAITDKHPVIVTTCYPPDIETSVLANIDYIFLFKSTNPTTRHQCYSRYAMNYMSKEQFEQMMDALVLYECIVFDARSNVAAIYKVNGIRNSNE
jgi:hypothetical protein